MYVCFASYNSATDLGTLKEKMDLCDSMLNPDAGTPALSVKTSEAMLAVIGFLEACAPRMIELVEAAASGALSETVFEEVLQCNDRLQKQLTDVETAAQTETTIATTAAAASSGAAAGIDLTSQFDDLLLGSMDDPSSTSLAGAPVVGTKTTGEEDFFSEETKPAAGNGEDDDAKPPAINQTSSDDEFDAFFADRQG